MVFGEYNFNIIEHKCAEKMPMSHVCRTYPDLKQFKVLKLLTFQYFVLIETCLTSAEEI